MRAVWYNRLLTGDDLFFTREILKMRPSCMIFWAGGKLTIIQKKFPSSVSQSRAQLAEHHYFIYLSLFFSLLSVRSDNKPFDRR